MCKVLEKKGDHNAYFRAIKDLFDEVKTSVRTHGGIKPLAKLKIFPMARNLIIKKILGGIIFGCKYFVSLQKGYQNKMNYVFLLKPFSKLFLKNKFFDIF